jgi:hypothetical protein
MLLVPAIIRKTKLIGKESYMILIGLASGAIGNMVFALSKSTIGIFSCETFN